MRDRSSARLTDARTATSVQMKTFEFSVVASGLDPSDENFEALFYDGRCDDATVSFQKGRTIVDFAREASGIEEAIVSAVRDVAAVGATVDRIEPDPLVSLADIAARSCMTRAAISHYANGSRGKDFPAFPAPVVRVTSDSPLYDWVSVASWLFENGRLPRDAVVMAEAVAQANLVLGSGAADFGSCLQQQLATRRALSVA